MFMLHVRLIFITKYRGKVFNNAYLETMKRIMDGVCGKFEAEIQELNGEQDHAHLLVTYPPKVALYKLNNSLKGVSSRKMKHHPDLIKLAHMTDALWPPSYFAGSVPCLKC